MHRYPSRAWAGALTVALTASALLVAPAAPAAGAAAGPAPAPTASVAFAPDRILVLPRADVSPAALRRTDDLLGTRVERVSPRSRVREVHLPPGLSVAEAVRRYEASGTAAYVEPDFALRPSATPVRPGDPGFAQMYGLDNTGQTGGALDADIDAPEAWATATGSASSLVAVIDTGVDTSHPDLSANIWTNPGEVAGNGVDDDGNGYVDDVHGWDFCHNDSTVFDGAAYDSHGTHVAGTIAAVGGNGVGVVGVSWRASVMSLKFLEDTAGCGWVSDAVEAIDYAVAQGARVSNNSWGGASYSAVLRDAIDRAGAQGHLFVAAAGNGGGDGIGDNLDATPDYPASYTSPNLVAVAATDHRDQLASFSNFGVVSADLAAPGVSILSTLPGNRYGWYSGTSMAAPHVSGAATLVLANEPQLTAAAVKARLLDGADDVAGLATKTVTGGRLNLAAALPVQSDPSPSPSPSPTPTPTPTPVATSLTLSVPTSVTLGQSFTLSGGLVTAGHAAVPGAAVTVEQRPVGGSTWSTLATLTTNADGSLSLPGVRPVRHTDYRLRFAGSPEPQLVAATSPTRRTHVRAATTAKSDRSNLKLGRGRALSGRVAPAHAGSVTVLVRRNGVVVARRTVTLSRSAYRLFYRPTRAGVYTFRARWAGDGDHLGSLSSPTGFRVVR